MYDKLPGLRLVPSFPRAPLVYHVPGVQIRIHIDDVRIVYNVPKGRMTLTQIVDHLNTQIIEGPVKRFEEDHGDLVYVTYKLAGKYQAFIRHLPK